MTLSSILSSLLYHAYGRTKTELVQRAIVKVVARLDGGYLRSPMLRKIFRDYHDLDIGLYTWGGCFNPRNFGRFVTIGRYSSLAMTACAVTQNHPLAWKSTHELFYNPRFRLCREERVGYSPLRIGNDVWMGANSIIMPSVSEVGDGAVIAAGAVVHKNVAPYAVVAGNPARVVRYRFSEPVIRQLLESRWWEKNIEEIAPQIAEFWGPYETGLPQRSPPFHAGSPSDPPPQIVPTAARPTTPVT